MSSDLEQIPARTEISGALPIRQWVRPQVITISPSCTIGELAQVFQSHRISGVPVVDNHNRLLGVVSQTDINRYWAQSRRDEPRHLIGFHEDMTVHSHLTDSAAEVDEGRVGDILTPFSHSVTPDTDLCEVVRLMLDYHIHRVPVVQDESVVGVVTTMDVLGALHEMLKHPAA